MLLPLLLLLLLLLLTAKFNAVTKPQKNKTKCVL